MAVQFNNMNAKQDLLEPQPNRRIVFTEHLNQRVFAVPTDEALAEACLLILKERFSNPVWNYKPATPRENLPTNEEIEFLKWHDTINLTSLPILVRKHVQRIYTQLTEHTNWATKHEWDWYDTVSQLLSLEKTDAMSYRKPYKGRYIPTSYYLLLQREHNPGEQLDLFLG